MKITKSDVNHYLARVSALHPTHIFELESAYGGYLITSAPKDCASGACSDFTTRDTLRATYDKARAMLDVLTLGA